MRGWFCGGRGIYSLVIMLSESIIKLIADGAVVPVVLIGAYALLFKVPKNARFEAYSRILMAGLTAFLVAKLLGTLYQPAIERPFELLHAAAGASYLDNPGFPSDHALFTAAITFAVWAETRSKWLTITLAVLTITVCVGRVLALVHTPLDVVGGISVAAVGALWYIVARPEHHKRNA
jgi:membrane-associated phospholipid phosphatase